MMSRAATSGSFRVVLSGCLAALALSWGCGGARPGTTDACPDGCDDGNACTDDRCDEASSACVFVPIASACEDGNACTAKDICKDGACSAGPKATCDDGNPCTNDGCNAKTGCTTTFTTEPCDDGNACTTSDLCMTGKCLGSTRDCDDDVACTTDSCDAKSGCVNAPNTDACDDGDACTKGEACDQGLCTGGTSVTCDDGNVCTKDVCDAKAGCTKASATGTPCDDGDGCTIDDACEGQTCKSGADKVCDDGDPCTVGEACKAGTCKAAGTKDCDDKVACTNDSCKAFVGCQNTAASGASCDDGSKCTQGDTCSFGKCQGKAANCDDGNACTDDSCNPKDGCVHAPNKAVCSDGDACTKADACFAGTCKGGPNVGCSLCGNGAIDGLGSDAPKKCASTTATVVKSYKQLLSWSVASNTPLVVDAALDLGGASLVIATPCDVTFNSSAAVSGMADASIGAAKVVVKSKIVASGSVVVHATKAIEVAGSGTFEVGSANGARLELESPSVNVAGQLHFGGGLCVEAGAMSIGADGSVGASLMKGKGAVKLMSKGDLAVTARFTTPAAFSAKAKKVAKLAAATRFNSAKSVTVDAGTDLAWRAHTIGVGTVSATAGNDLTVFEGAKLGSDGNVTFKASGALKIGGNIDQKGQLIAAGDTLALLTKGSITGAGGVDLSMKSASGKLLVGGQIAGANLVSISASKIHIEKTGAATNNTTVGVFGGESVTIDGNLSQNQSVLVKSKLVTVNAGHSMVGNQSCALQGKVVKNAKCGCQTAGG